MGPPATSPSTAKTHGAGRVTSQGPGEGLSWPLRPECPAAPSRLCALLIPAAAKALPRPSRRDCELQRLEDHVSAMFIGRPESRRKAGSLRVNTGGSRRFRTVLPSLRMRRRCSDSAFAETLVIPLEHRMPKDQSVAVILNELQARFLRSGPFPAFACAGEVQAPCRVPGRAVGPCERRKRAYGLVLFKARGCDDEEWELPVSLVGGEIAWRTVPRLSAFDFSRHLSLSRRNAADGRQEHKRLRLPLVYSAASGLLGAFF